LVASPPVTESEACWNAKNSRRVWLTTFHEGREGGAENDDRNTEEDETKTREVKRRKRNERNRELFERKGG
jgi:hypothetical protein